MPKELPSPEMLRKLLSYDPETGLFTWLERGVDLFSNGAKTAEANCDWWNGRFSGRPALISRDTHGYASGKIFGRKVLAHRVAMAIHFGRWPEHDVDHINGIRDDNRIANLRNATRSENMRNRIAPKNNTSGTMGVSWHSGIQKYVAYISVSGRRKSLGCYDTKVAAIEARLSAERENMYTTRTRQSSRPTTS